jgi:hypothetical protein
LKLEATLKIKKKSTKSIKGGDLEISTTRRAYRQQGGLCSNTAREEGGAGQGRFFFIGFKPAETYLVAGPWGAVASCYLHE